MIGEQYRYFLFIPHSIRLYVDLYCHFIIIIIIIIIIITDMHWVFTNHERLPIVGMVCR